MITQNYQSLTPAYGRDYKSKAAVEADFRAGKDFMLNSYGGSGLVSVRDFAPGVRVNIRYKQQRSVAVVTV
jgi:hypothetical protein